MKMTEERKIIVTVAPVGADIEPPSINPLTHQEVAAEVIACAQAGASMVHLHVRDSQGVQTENLADYSAALDLIQESSEILVDGSTGGITGLSLEERCVALNDPRTDVASLNMGSFNFGEEVFINKVSDIRYWARRMEDSNVLPELEIFSSGTLATYPRLVEEGILKPPYYVNLVLGFEWALPANVDTLHYMQSQLPEKNTPWGVVHSGMQDLSLLATAIGMGASVVRVGFEDSVYYAPNQAAKTNAELVERVVSLIRQIGFKAATYDEAKDILGITR
jgi:3-keto-5-aminohexanoate cleavage enzyme